MFCGFFVLTGYTVPSLFLHNSKFPAYDMFQIDDATGEVREYGPTSVFKHLPTTDALVASSAQSGTFLSSTNPTGAGNAPVVSLPDGFNEAMHKEALQAFFTFFNPWCWWVDEKRFRIDMGVTSAEMGGSVRTNIQTPYYGPLLHFAALAIGVMYLDNVSYTNRELISDSFAQNSVNFFEEEIETAKLSTVIGLMLLGTHHAGHARPSLGYIYSGAGLRLTRIRECISTSLLTSPTSITQRQEGRCCHAGIG